MFCPRCATQNVDDARFCRSCGTDISLVPQALSGTLAERLAAAEAAVVEEDDRRGRRRKRRKREEPVSFERAFEGIFKGIALIFVAFAIRSWAPAGDLWWWAMFFPAAFNFADGVSTFVRLASGERRRDARQPYAQPQAAVPPPRPVGVLPQRETGEMIPPPSVSEGTTRHLGVPAERKRGE